MILINSWGAHGRVHCLYDHKIGCHPCRVTWHTHNLLTSPVFFANMSDTSGNSDRSITDSPRLDSPSLATTAGGTSNLPPPVRIPSHMDSASADLQEPLHTRRHIDSALDSPLPCAHTRVHVHVAGETLLVCCVDTDTIADLMQKIVDKMIRMKPEHLYKNVAHPLRVATVRTATGGALLDVNDSVMYALRDGETVHAGECTLTNGASLCI
jgi:hypothetical protein